MKKILLSASLALFSLASFAQSAWTPDPAHSTVGFTIRHMGISLVAPSISSTAR